MQPDAASKLMMEFQSTRDSITEVVQKLSAALDELGLPDDAVFDIKLAAQEAVVNAVEHGNNCDESKTVRVCCEADEDCITVAVRDEGDGFDPAQVPDPTLPENILRESGRGIFLIRNLCDEVRFNEKGNEVTMVKRIPKGK